VKKTLKTQARFVAITFGVLLIGCVSGYSVAAELAYPSKPIRLIVPYPPGAGTDFTARALGEGISQGLGQAVVIDNRPGAGATLGHGLAARALADGYTLLLATTGGMVSGPALGLSLSYDPIKDFSPIGLATFVPYFLVVYGGLPVNSVEELIAYAKARPGQLNFGSPGTGTPNHVGGVLLMQLSGIDLMHIPYKGGGPVLTDLISGQLQATFASLPQVLPHTATHRLKLLGVGYTRRIKSAPEVPTIAESLPGFNNTGWWGLVAPRSISPQIILKLNSTINKSLMSPAVIQHFVNNGLEPTYSTPEKFAKVIAEDLQAWTLLVKKANIQLKSSPP
jgi:tripartite-type tricarboxylate transporter receptor subunit TctC